MSADKKNLSITVGFSYPAQNKQNAPLTKTVASSVPPKTHQQFTQGNNINWSRPSESMGGTCLPFLYYPCEN